MKDKLQKILQVLDFRFWAMLNILLFCLFALMGAEPKTLIVSGFSAIIWSLLAITEAIRESGININHIKISVDDSLSKAIRNEVLRDQAKALADLEAEIEAMEQADNWGEPDADDDTDTDDEAEDTVEQANEDEAVHRPLTEAPEDGTLVYLHIGNKHTIPIRYSKYSYSRELREGRIFATKEDALVCLYGRHYDTTKPEDEIGRGTLPSELDNYSQTTHNQMKQEQIKALQERMQSYIGTKHIRAVEMTRGEYNELRGWQIPSNENPDDYGYLVEYQNSSDGNVEGFDGYISWSPKQAFEEAYKVANDWIDRVNIELDELRAKIDKLSAFIDKGIKVDNLHIAQLSIMKEYALILENRLEHRQYIGGIWQ